MIHKTRNIEFTNDWIPSDAIYNERLNDYVL